MLSRMPKVSIAVATQLDKGTFRKAWRIVARIFQCSASDSKNLTPDTQKGLEKTWWPVAEVSADGFDVWKATGWYGSAGERKVLVQ